MYYVCVCACVYVCTRKFTWLPINDPLRCDVYVSGLLSLGAVCFRCCCLGSRALEIPVFMDLGERSFYGTHAKYLLVFRGVSPGCRLFSTDSMLELLLITPSPSLTGEEYGKMEPKYPEGGHCQSVLHPQGVFNAPPLF